MDFLANSEIPLDYELKLIAINLTLFDFCFKLQYGIIQLNYQRVEPQPINRIVNSKGIKEKS